MKRSRRSLMVLISMFAVLSLVLAACTGDDDDGGGNGEAPVATPTATTEAEPEAEATTPAAEEDEDDEGEEEGGGGTAGTEGDPEAGEAIWQSQCMSCHTIDGSEGLGPTWQGLWMSEVPLEDGSTVTADEEYITESIREPNAKVHEGFQPVMPAFNLDDDEIADIIAFIQTLE